MSDLIRKWSESSGAWIESVEDDISRKGLLDHRFLAALGDPAGKRILDIGCGEGRMCRRLAELGARCTGIDPTPELLAQSRRRDPDGDYYHLGAEEIPWIEEFDVAFFMLSLVDIPDLRPAVKLAARATKPGGRVIAVDINAFMTCSPEAFVVNEKGERTHVEVRDYAQERPQEVSWKGISIINFHRPADAYFRAFLEAGLILKTFDEITPTDEEIEAYPILALHRIAPYFNITTWQKT